MELRTSDSTAEVVSVVIPCYNVEDCVERAVESALNQSIPLEIICIEDGSSDGTLAVLRRMESDHPQVIRVWTGPNAGACAARNRGLAQCSSPYVQFLDADDYLDPTKLEAQFRLAASQNADFVAGSYIYRDLNGDQAIHHSRPGTPWVRLFQKRIGNTVANLWKRKALVSVGGWNEGLESSQETDLMFRLLKSGSSVVFDTEPRTTVYAREESISYTFSGPNRERYASIRVDALVHCESQDLLNAPDLADAREAVFNSIRWLYPYAPSSASSLYRRAFPRRYCPPISPTNTRRFVWACRALGYPAAERLRLSLWA